MTIACPTEDSELARRSQLAGQTCNKEPCRKGWLMLTSAVGNV
eukprot:COSAG06_NODE_54118_length_296_cov_0.791878_1_plen_42_part_01